MFEFFGLGVFVGVCVVVGVRGEDEEILFRFGSGRGFADGSG